MKAYLVGGAIRDQLLGLKIEDKDWVVIGSSKDEMLELGFEFVRGEFPVFLHPLTNEEYSLARMEKKISPGHNGFAFNVSSNITLRQDLKRRDLTINAIAQDVHGIYVDPFHGLQDLNDRVIRHVSTNFKEDPLRVLRASRFAAKLHPFSFVIDDNTMDLMSEMSRKNELDHISGERIYSEMLKAFNTLHIPIFFQVLREINALAGKLKLLNRIADYSEMHSVKLKFLRRNMLLSFDIFLALALSYSDSIKEVDYVLDLIKVRKNTASLCRNFYYYGRALKGIYNHSAKDILATLKKTNILRSHQHFMALLGVVQCAEYIDDKFNRASFQNLEAIAKTLKSYPYKELVKRNKIQRNLPNQIYCQQLRIIQQLI